MKYYFLPFLLLLGTSQVIAETADDLWADTDWEDEAVAQSSGLAGLGISGFSELRYGQRTRSDDNQRQTSLAEWRLQLEKTFTLGAGFSLATQVDVLYDDVEPTQRNDLNSGRGWLDVRGFSLQKSSSHFDIKVGRQIITWGVGDLVFINDLFPKDWNSFLIGRDEEYLKAPSDAIRLGAYSDIFNIDFVLSPEFDADRFVDGRRVSYFNTALDAVAGRNALIEVEQPETPEFSLRLYKSIDAVEYALYAYDGHWKSPGGVNPISGRAIFPELTVLGASVRGPIWGGIGSLELGHYNSRDDKDGDNPFINNSEVRGLVSYEWSPFANANTNVQYYVEAMQDYDAYRDNLDPRQTPRDRFRHVMTTRLSYLSHQQNVTWSLFIFYSPSDKDAYFRPKVNYRLTDHWQMEAGFNFFTGSEVETFFGQFENNSSGYLSIRYNF